jgi:nucleotide-binding universal stress UspA family protein
MLTHQKEFEEEERERAREVLDRAAERIHPAASSNGHLKVTTEILDGSAKRVIVEEAERWGADLIVVGSHGYRSWERMLMGSVSQAVAMHAECSVEIVRQPKRKGN